MVSVMQVRVVSRSFSQVIKCSILSMLYMHKTMHNPILSSQLESDHTKETQGKKNRLTVCV